MQNSDKPIRSIGRSKHSTIRCIWWQPKSQTRFSHRLRRSWLWNSTQWIFTRNSAHHRFKQPITLFLKRRNSLHLNQLSLRWFRRVQLQEALERSPHNTSLKKRNLNKTLCSLIQTRMRNHQLLEEAEDDHMVMNTIHIWKPQNPKVFNFVVIFIYFPYLILKFAHFHSYWLLVASMYIFTQICSW
jgi:hypothetical protein